MIECKSPTFKEIKNKIKMREVNTNPWFLLILLSKFEICTLYVFDVMWKRDNKFDPDFYVFRYRQIFVWRHLI